MLLYQKNDPPKGGSFFWKASVPCREWAYSTINNAGRYDLDYIHVQNIIAASDSIAKYDHFIPRARSKYLQKGRPISEFVGFYEDALEIRLDFFKNPQA